LEEQKGGGGWNKDNGFPKKRAVIDEEETRIVKGKVRPSGVIIKSKKKIKASSNNASLGLCMGSREESEG